MKGSTIAERAKRRAALVNKKAKPRDKRLTAWLDPTTQNRTWLANEIRIGEMPGHGRRGLIMNKAGQMALEWVGK